MFGGLNSLSIAWRGEMFVYSLYSIARPDQRHHEPAQPPSTLPLLDLAVSEMQETSHWPTHRWDVMSKQRKSNRQHPNTYYREWEETEHSGTNQCDATWHPHPDCTRPTKTTQVFADPGRDVIVEAVHFLVEIGSLRHHRLSGTHLFVSIVISEMTSTLTQRDGWL